MAFNKLVWWYSAPPVGAGAADLDLVVEHLAVVGDTGVVGAVGAAGAMGAAGVPPRVWLLLLGSWDEGRGLGGLKREWYLSKMGDRDDTRGHRVPIQLVFSLMQPLHGYDSRIAMTMSWTTSLSSSSVRHPLDGAAGVDGNYCLAAWHSVVEDPILPYRWKRSITVINVKADNFPMEFMIIWGIRKVDKDIFPNLLSITQAYWRKVSEKEP
ncbi:hypothetical protein DFP72DRAFT_860591 [Ephemerocybe angulata]|uniref:Uncharacterized protein n=1 Tax=Ephemerocybe angulata TaxID=980116 RepID=A0A8H6LU59_9AGAR|nr:hypothetical protein DFP72DRAFT_860591 [Tulosesus angulatus]